MTRDPTNDEPPEIQSLLDALVVSMLPDKTDDEYYSARRAVANTMWNAPPPVVLVDADMKALEQWRDEAIAELTAIRDICLSVEPLFPRYFAKSVLDRIKKVLP